MRGIALATTTVAFAGAGLSACVPSAPSTTSSPATKAVAYAVTGMPAVQARQADSLVDSFGLKVETSSSTGMYGQRATVMAKLKTLGVRHIRTDFFNGNNGQYAYLNQLKSQLGITSLLTMGRPGQSASTLVKTAATKVPNAIFAFEGTNEWDILGGSNWAGEVRTYQRQLFEAVNASPVVRNKPVYGPAMGRDTTFGALGNISSWMDYGNLHTYPGGRPPSASLDMRLSRSALTRGSKPVVSTETGYHDLIPTSNGHRPASDTAAALYYPRLLLEDIRYGMGHTFAFELIDNASSATFRNRLGLLRRDWSPKPQFTALSNMLKIAADPGKSFTPGKLSYTLSGAPADMHTQLYQKRDGTFMLYIWRDVSVWDQNKYKTLNPGTKTVTVNLAKTSTVRTYRPTQSATPRATTTGSKISVSVTGEVVALAIK